MKSPWKSVRPLEAGREYLVLASSIPTRRLASTFRMFAGASAVRRQLEGAEGLVGFSLLARPLRKQYATLSVWADDEALATFTSARPHAELMSALAPEMGPTKFVRWMIDGFDGPPSWTDAVRRLEAEPPG